jgi:hypothetical protein
MLDQHLRTASNSAVAPRTHSTVSYSPANTDSPSTGLLGWHAVADARKVLLVDTIGRCTAPDVHKDTVMGCVRVPDGAGGRGPGGARAPRLHRRVTGVTCLAAGHGVIHFALPG